MSDRVIGTILVTVAIVLAAYKLWKLFRELYRDIKFKSEKTGDAVSAEQYMDELTEQESDSPGQPGSDGAPQDASQGQEGPQPAQEGQDGNPAGQGSGSQGQGGSEDFDGEEVEQLVKDVLKAAVEDGTVTKQDANHILRTMEYANLLKEYSERKGEAGSKKDQPPRSDASGAEEDKKPKSDEELLQQALATCGMTEEDIKEGRGSENPTGKTASHAQQEISKISKSNYESSKTASSQPNCSSKDCDSQKEANLANTKEKLAEKLDKSLFDIMSLKALSLDALDTTMVAIQGEALTLRELIVYIALCKSCHGEAELYMSRKLSYYIQMGDGYGIPRLYDCLAEKLQGLLPKDRRLEMIKEPGRLHDLVNSNDIL